MCVSKWWITVFIDIKRKHYGMNEKGKKEKRIKWRKKEWKYTRNGNEQISTNYVNFMCFFIALHWMNRMNIWTASSEWTWLQVIFFFGRLLRFVSECVRVVRLRVCLCVTVWWVFHCSRWLCSNRIHLPHIKIIYMNTQTHIQLQKSSRIKSFHFKCIYV